MPENVRPGDEGIAPVDKLVLLAEQMIEGANEIKALVSMLSGDGEAPSDDTEQA